MLVTVKEVRKTLEQLDTYYQEFLRLQNYAMCLDLTKSGESSYADSPEKDARREILQKIREEADITMNLRTLFTVGCEMCKNEMARIQNIIDNQKVNI